jgi:hypothetical protein
VTAPARIAAFVAILAATFGLAAVAGGALEPLRADGGERPAGGHPEAHGGAEEPAPEPARPRGLAVADAGYRLVLEPASPSIGRPVDLTFRVLRRDGRPVEDFEQQHERAMHLIVVRRDLTGYQHVHPVRGTGGRWTVRLTLPEAGVYRAFADFRAGGRDVTLATDVLVSGVFRPRALPAPVARVRADRYEGRLITGGLSPGAEAQLTYEISRAGVPATGLEPYLGADGHLVALREGDLAFLHVHPEPASRPGRVAFGATLPSAGRYRLFLQFKIDGRVRTVGHTLEVAP